MEIKLNELLNIKPEDYKDWTLCLNHPHDCPYSLKENYDRLMEHLSWKRGIGENTVFVG